MADILGIFNHIQQQGEKGRQSGLARLLGKAYNAPPEQRQAALGQIAQHDGGLAMSANKAFREEDGEVLSQLSDHARQVVALYKADPNMAQQAYQAMLPLAQRAGITTAPQQLDDTVIGGLTQLAQVNLKAGAGGVQSTQIGDDGYFYTVDRQTGQFQNSGIKASPTLRVMEQEGQNPYGVVTSRGVPGQVRTLGSGQPAPPPQGPTGTAGNPAPSGHVDQTTELANQMIAADIPEAQVEAFIRSRLNPGQQGGQQAAPAPAGGQPAPGAFPGLTGPQAGPVRIPTSAEKAAAEEAARRGVGLQFADAEARAAAEQARMVKEAEAAAGFAEEDATRTRDAGDVLNLLDEAERLIPESTGSGVGALADQAAGFVGLSDPGGEAISSLQAIAGRLVAKMPRMEGPQSDNDVILYKQAAGDLANPWLPRRRRLAAAATVRSLHEKYPTSQRAPSDGPVRITSAADYEALPSGAEFIAPDGTRRRKR